MSFQNCECLVYLPEKDVLTLSTDFALDPHEGSCFALRSQRLIERMKCVVVHL